MVACCRQSWGVFGVLVTIVLSALYVVWVNDDTGFGDDYLRAVESISSGPEVSARCMYYLRILIGTLPNACLLLPPVM